MLRPETWLTCLLKESGLSTNPRIKTTHWFQIGSATYPTPSSTREWKTIEPQDINIENLFTQQQFITFAGLWGVFRGRRSEWCDDIYPHIVLSEDKYWITDGHHRIIMSRLKRNKNMKVRVFKGE
jgi:hypothetical protein